MANENRATSALVTNTMLVQAASFLNDPDAALPTPIHGLFDLISLIEAVILRTRLTTLEGTLDEGNMEFLRHPLLSALINAGVLEIGTVKLDHASIERALLHLVGTDRLFNRLEVAGISYRLTEMLPEVFPEQVATSSQPTSPSGRISFLYALTHPSNREPLTTPLSITAFFRSDQFTEFLRGTGTVQRGGYALRTYVYSQCAVNERLAFIPDFPRIVLLSRALDQIYVGILDHLTEFLGKLECEAQDFLAEAQPIGLPIPPFASLVFSRAATSEDIPKVLLEVREEFAQLRKNLSRLELALRNSVTIRERAEARRATEAAFAAVAKRFQRSGMTTFRRLADFAEDATGAALEGRYTSALLTKPVEWLRDWWYRRPLAQFLDLADEFRNITHYQEVARRLFDLEFSRQDIEDFRYAREMFRTMFSGASQ